MSENSSIEVTVKFLGVFRKVYGKTKATIRIKKNENLGNMIKQLCSKRPDLEKVLVDPELGTPLPNAVILVNNQEIGLLNGLETSLRDKDKIVFIPVIHGG
ncbi:MAG: MoaD/ThiS family protein [Candidatus Jordarchaeaceae archaeon]